jgi:hypothetical protein
MIDLVRKTAYAPGDTIRAVLRFRWEEEFEAVMVEFHRTTFGGAAYGNRIVLRGRNHERTVEDERSCIVANLEGIVPDQIRPGTYVCRYVRCFVPGRGWVILFENVYGASLSVRRRSPVALPGREGAEFLALEVRA